MSRFVARAASVVLLFVVSLSAMAETVAPIAFWNVPNYYSGNWNNIRYPSPEEAFQSEWARNSPQCQGGPYDVFYDISDYFYFPDNRVWPDPSGSWVGVHYYWKRCDGSETIGPAEFGDAARIYVSCTNQGPFYKSSNGLNCSLSPTAPQPELNRGKPRCSKQCKGDPVNAGNGNKLEIRTEYLGHGPFPLEFTWTYNSKGTSFTASRNDLVLGRNRSGTYSRRVSVFTAGTVSTAYLSRPDGKTYHFNKVGSSWVPEASLRGTLTDVTDGTGAIVGRVFIAEDGSSESFDASGRLLALHDSADHAQVLSYNSIGQLVTVTDERGRKLVFNYTGHLLSKLDLPDGSSLRFFYTANDDLEHVTYPDGQIVHYLYDEAAYAPSSTGGLLTGKTDELGNRVDSTIYDSSNWAISTAEPGLAPYSLSYIVDSSGYATAAAGTSPLGATEQMAFAITNGNIVLTSEDVSCTGCAAQHTSYTYDSTGQIDLVTKNGVVTDYDYNSRGLLSQRIDAATDTTGAKRTIQTDWHPAFSVPLERRSYNAAGALASKQTWTYNSRGQVLTASRIDPATGATRTATMTYCEQADVDAGTCPLIGLVRSINGPRTNLSDVTTFTYYASDDASCASAPTTCPHRKGDLWKVTNALGQVTETLAYDGGGGVLSVKDPNGVVTDMTYNLRGWLTARKVRGPDNAVETDDSIIRIDYWPTGLVKQVTQPDGSYTAYGYDAAHRLTDISDNVGNSIHYTLDNAGDRTAEDTKDPSGTLTRTLSRVFNQLGQLQSQRDASLHSTTFTFDANGNSDLVTDAASHVTNSDYDPLNRLTRTLQDVGGIEASTQFHYDAVDNLTQVIDPNGLVTGYGYDGLGNLTSLSSPDTGGTSYAYDSAGNRTSQTDARGKVTNFSYDAINRLASATYATSSLNVTSTYDTVNAVCGTGETFAVGRLTQLIMGNGDSTQYCYDRFGNLVRKVETVNGKTFTLRYTYNFAGRLLSLTYPDGTVADYVRNAGGRVIEVGVTPSGGSRQVLLSGASYYPFGQAKQWTFGNGRIFQRTLDLDYRPWAISDSGTDGLSLGYTFDAVGNLSELRDAGQAGPPQTTFRYDALNRLTDFLDGPSGVAIEHYAYDATGNRTLFQNSGGSQSYAYDTGTHHLGQAGSVARSYDEVGNTAGIGSTSEFTYSDANRMNSVKQNGTVVMNYRYNGKGERVHRFLTTMGANQTYTVYDEAGHWLGDYDSNGAPIQQAIWLDDLPVGLLAAANTSQTLDYVEADALGTPRAVLDPTRNVAIWTWDLKNEAFGNSPPNQDPDLDGTAFVFNLRFPGQQYDSASGLTYNYFRDYEAATGRYVESDPIGFGGGISTYGYVGGNPMARFDPMGLYCRSAGGVTHCQYPGGPSFNVPTQRGWKDFDASDFLYHNYDVQRDIQCAKAADVMGEFIAHPTPSPYARPATPGGTRRNDASVPNLPVNNLVTSYLTTDLRTGQPLVVNITAPGSFFDPGYVAREVINGVAHTYGEGANWVQQTNIWPGEDLNWYMDERVWGWQMRDFIDKHAKNCGCQ